MKQGWRGVVADGGLLFLVGCGLVLAVLLITRGPQATAPVAAIMGVVLGLPALVIALRGWARRGRQATADQVGQARESLAGWVIDQWRHEALARSLGNPQPMPVQWQLTEHAVMDHPRLIMAGGLSFTGRSDQLGPLAEQFRGLPRRRLVILGGPGSGKTTLAVQLLLELLTTRQPVDPIPVLLSLASWNTTTHPQLHGWLAERLAEDYPSLRAFGPDVARALAEQGHILPIIDGFDEISSARQPDVITALNASLTEADHLVLTSRTEEYRTAIAEAHTVLTATAVIEPEPLTGAQAAEYLAACLPPAPGPSWSDVLNQLRAGTAHHLATVAATPLGLWLLRTVYITARADPRPLLSSETARDAPVLQAYLFDQLIPAVLTTRPVSRKQNESFRPCRTWDPSKVRSWLTYLARHLHRTQTRDLLWWHLARHTFTRREFGLAAGLVSGLGAGLLAGLALGLVFGLGDGLVRGLVFGVGVGLGAGLLFGLVAGAGIRLRTVLVVGLVTGLGGGLSAGLADKLWGGLWFGLVFGLGSGLGAGLRAWLGQDWLTDEPAYVDLRLEHRTGRLLRDLGAGLVFGLGAGLVFGLVVVLVYGLVDGSASDPGRLVGGLLSDLVPWSVGGLLVGLLGGLFKWVETPSKTGWVSTPRSTYKMTRALTVIQVCTGGLVVGLVFALLVGLVLGWGTGLGFGLVFGLGVGLVFGLGLMSSGAWFSCLLTLCRLAAANKLPLRLMDFLDDAYRLGLVRTSGPAYQFRHAEFQDHLIRTAGSEAE